MSSPDLPLAQEKNEHSPSSSWHSAYMAAVSENDRAKVPARIRYAAQLILQREHELLQQKTHQDERRALNNALHALRTLQTFVLPKAG